MLDAATEARVGRALKTLWRPETTFIIAHRLSTVRDPDESLVFDQGSVVERGGFAELIAREGRFADLVATQLARPLPAMADGMATRANSIVAVPASPSSGRVRLLKPRNISGRQLWDCRCKHRVHGGKGHRRCDDDDPAA